MTKRAFAAGACLLLAFAFPSCARNRNSVTLAGSTAFLPFAEKLAEDYMRLHPEASISVQGGGSAQGIAAALYGTVQIGMADLVSLPEEAASLDATVVARDGIAIVVHPGNPVNGLSTEQVRGIFSGSIRNWKEVGGADSPITVVSREAGSGTRSSFEKIVKSKVLYEKAIIQDSNGTIRETVATIADSVGYLSHGLVSDKVKALDIDGVHPSIQEINAGRYALVRPVFFLTRPGKTLEGTAAFIDFVLSAQGQRTIADNGLIPAVLP